MLTLGTYFLHCLDEPTTKLDFPGHRGAVIGRFLLQWHTNRICHHTIMVHTSNRYIELPEKVKLL